MATIAYRYSFRCWCVFVDGKCIGKTPHMADAIQWMEDYNELHSR